jgi:hypothetical protein
MEVSLFTLKLVAALEPKATAVAPVKLQPLIATDVPPPEGPRVGVIPVTAGVVPGSTSSDADAVMVPVTGVEFGWVKVTF